jgi:hypothetical protein
MDTATLPAPAAVPADPLALLAALDPEQIRARLDTLEREARALRVLLRSTMARRAHRGEVRSGD